MCESPLSKSIANADAPEIEITSEMIEVGTEVLGMYDPAEDGVTGWAEEIYREMERVRRLGESQPSHAGSFRKTDTL